MKFLASSVIFLLIRSSTALKFNRSSESGKNTLSLVTICSTCALFVFSIITLVVSALSLLKARRIRHFKLSEPQTQIYYKNKGRLRS
ncbi:unnamed protein product [Caenorhabditis sp. 36 PRJEB53466]|nr:unnamed protein product [Caenorhabditis sp. 36 PRJEB53466]